MRSLFVMSLMLSIGSVAFSCPDFSGKWGKGNTVAFVIKQVGCSEVTIAVGGSSSTAKTDGVTRRSDLPSDPAAEIWTVRGEFIGSALVYDYTATAFKGGKINFYSNKEDFNLTNNGQLLTKNWSQFDDDGNVTQKNSGSYTKIP